MSESTCVTCGARFKQPGGYERKNCPAHRRTGKIRDTPCSMCGKLLFPSPSSRKNGKATCRSCRSQHGGSRCTDCGIRVKLNTASAERPRCRACHQHAQLQHRTHVCSWCGDLFQWNRNNRGAVYCSNTCRGMDRRV